MGIPNTLWMKMTITCKDDDSNSDTTTTTTTNQSIPRCYFSNITALTKNDCGVIQTLKTTQCKTMSTYNLTNQRVLGIPIDHSITHCCLARYLLLVSKCCSAQLLTRSVYGAIRGLSRDAIDRSSLGRTPATLCQPNCICLFDPKTFQETQLGYFYSLCQ
jgi:hypothetical protein